MTIFLSFFKFIVCGLFAKVDYIRQSKFRRLLKKLLKDRGNMVKTLLMTVAFLLAGVALLSVSIWVRKDGKFPNIHVGKNPAMRKRGVGCVEAQDAQAQKPSPFAVRERRINNTDR